MGEFKPKILSYLPDRLSVGVQISIKIDLVVQVYALRLHSIAASQVSFPQG